MRGRELDRRGFALIAVLWVLVIGGALALELTGAVRADQRAVSAARSEARARWAARGALAVAAAEVETVLRTDSAARVLMEPGSRVWQPFTASFGDAEARVELVDARARLRIAGAEPLRIAALLTALGWQPAAARTLAERIADWQDADDRPRPRGAETAEYEAAGAAARPANRPIRAVSELREVPGLGGAVDGELGAYLTTAGDGLINVNSAPVAVLATLPGITADAATALVRLRAERGPVRSVTELATRLPPPARSALLDAGADGNRIAVSPRVVDVRITVLDADGVARTRTGTLTLEGGRGLSIGPLIAR